MIDVPYEVKKALREGTYRKNYRFIVQKEVTNRTVADVDTLDAYNLTYTVMVSGNYILYSEDSTQAFDTVTISASGGATMQWPCPVGETETWFEIPVTLAPGVEISVNSINVNDLHLTKTDLVSYTTNWVDDFTIDNDNLVKESVNIDERMCSGDTIKYGLCEGSSLEFQYFEKPNITGRRVQAFCDVQYGEGANDWHPIPMGYFTVKKCSRQASTGIIKATAYNKLQSDYLDAKANNLLLESFSSDDEEVMIYDIQDLLLNDYQIKHEIIPVSPQEGSLLGGYDWVPNIRFFFTELYGIETPLSAFEYEDEMGDRPTTSTPIYIVINSGAATYDMNNESDVWKLRENYGPLRIFERNVYDRLKFIMEGAKLRTSSTTAPFNGGIVDGQMFVDYICKHYGFYKVCGIEVLRNYVITEKYSTIQWEYEERNNITHTVNGTIDDFIRATREGKATIRVIFPVDFNGCVSLWQSGGVPSFVKIPFGQTKFFHYWSDNTYTSFGAIWLYPIKYGNGEDFVCDYTIVESNMLDAITVGIVQLNDADKIKVNISELSDFTLRDIISASYETVGLFGQLSRTTDLFSGVELGHSRLLPAETLYPATDLYPSGARLSGSKAMYSKLWADEGNIHKWRYLIITYKGLDEEQNEKEFTLQRTVNSDGTDDYNCSDNWLFKNLIWTAEQIGDYADAMVSKMQDVTWFPFEMWCAGLPYLETGDEIEIPLGDQKYVSYVLQRQLKGIQNLQDTYINGTLDIY